MRGFSWVGAFALSAALVGSAQASVTIYTSQSAFSAAAATAHLATFKGLPYGPTLGPLVQDGITMRTLPGAHDLFVTYSGQPLTLNPVSFATEALSANGDENFKFSLSSGATFGSIGIDYATNRYAAPVLSLFTLSGGLIGAFTIPQAPNSLGFFGLISSTPIGYATSIVDRGYIADTAIDNVRIGPVRGPSGVPEPATWALMLSGFGLAGAALRRRRPAARTA